jgi:photosystem II stability/assembly factor-like uncharacterized protein
MMTVQGNPKIAATIVVALFVLASPVGPAAAETTAVSELAGQTHIHGLAVDRSDPAFLLIATHHGLYRAGRDGSAVRLSEVQDFMGFNPHPSDPDLLYASGHPVGGGNLGFVASRDGGRTWNQVSPGLDGPVDFHQLAVSPADPSRIYGAYGGLQLSDDGGKTWTMVGPLPQKIIDMAASVKNADVLYAATETGLIISLDAGGSWKPLLEGPPVTLVEVAPDGIYAFIHGEGLMRASEGTFDWTMLNSNWGSAYLLHLAVDPTSADRTYAATGNGVVLESTDGGRTWDGYGR